MVANVCVIIAARNAADTIGMAIYSALREKEVAEVIVIDDASNDGTATAARVADDGSGRLNVVSFQSNRGPSAARNHAIEISTAPLIAILDADDFFFDGRFSRMLAEDDWDFIADNIAFVDSGTVALAQDRIDNFPDHPLFLDLVEFIDGNITKRGVRRGEIGFLKPVMRRTFLDANKLHYRDEMRLGEDYELYVRALAKGARYKVIHSCGYGAVVRGNSLSGSHRTEDIRKLYEADQAILRSCQLTPEGIAAVRRHENYARRKYALRYFLDIKNKAGLAAALRYALANPGAVSAIATGVFMDKTARFRDPDRVATALASEGRLCYLLAIPEK